MGRSTSSNICRNVANLAEFSGLLNYDNEGQNATQFDPSGSGEIISLPHDWKRLAPPEGQLCHQYGRLYIDFAFRKIIADGKTDNLDVFIVNTAEYSNGGEEYYVVFSDQAGAVERFLEDFAIPAEEANLAEQDSVHQTL